jgi:hypothetical protein
MLTVTESRCELVRNATAEARVIAKAWAECAEMGDSYAVARITGVGLGWALVTAAAQLRQIAEQG